MPKTETKRAATRRLVSGFLERNPQTVTVAAVAVAAVKPTKATAAPVAFRVAAEVPSWCHPCGDERAHRVVAMARTGKPYRVQCVSCQGVHAYRDPAAKREALAKVAAAAAKRAAREVAKVEKAAAKAAKPPAAVEVVTTEGGGTEARATARATKRAAVEARKARKAARAERKAAKLAEKEARAAERARKKAARERPPGELRRLLITYRNAEGKIVTEARAVIVPRDAMAKRPLGLTDAELAARKAARAAEADERKAREKRRLMLRRKNAETCAAIGYRERRRNRPPATAGAKAGQRCSCDANSAGQKWAARMVREIHRGA